MISTPGNGNEKRKPASSRANRDDQQDERQDGSTTLPISACITVGGAMFNKYAHRPGLGSFLGRTDVSDIMLAQAVATKPLRELLSQCFLKERDARLVAAGADDLRPTGTTLLLDLIKDNGAVDQCADALDRNVTATEPTACALADPSLFDCPADEVFDRNRCLALRAWSSFGTRIREPIKRPNTWFGLHRVHGDMAFESAATNLHSSSPGRWSLGCFYMFASLAVALLCDCLGRRYWRRGCASQSEEAPSRIHWPESLLRRQAIRFPSETTNQRAATRVRRIHPDFRQLATAFAMGGEYPATSDNRIDGDSPRALL